MYPLKTVIKVSVDARERNYWDSAFPHLKFYIKNIRDPQPPVAVLYTSLTSDFQL